MRNGHQEMLRIGLVLALATALLTPAAYAQQGVGAGAGFRWGVDARALALGGAYVAVADGYSALYWNPAGLATIGTLTAGYMATNKFELDIDYTYLAGAGAIHLQVLDGALTLTGALGAGRLQQRISGIEQFGPDGQPLGTVEDVDGVFIGSVATGIRFGIFRLALGQSSKWYSHRLAGEEGKGRGSDFGFLVRVGEVLSLGMSVMDMGGTGITWTTGAQDLVESLMRVGVALRLLDDRILLTAQKDFSAAPEFREGALRVGVALDWWRSLMPAPPPSLPMKLRLRWGYIQPPDSASLVLANSGVGIEFFGLQLDWTVVRNPTLGDSTVVQAALNLRF